MMRYPFFALFLFAAFFQGCKSPASRNEFDQLFGRQSVSSIKYARLFDIYKKNGIKKVVIHSPFNDSTEAAVFYLIEKQQTGKYRHDPHILPFPLTRVGVLSATQLNAVLQLGLINQVAGISDSRLLSSREIKKRLRNGKLTEISQNGKLFVEKTLAVKPEAVFYSPYKNGQHLPVKGGIVEVPFFDFFEENPLGRAEWIKLTAAFMGNEKKADSLFSAIEKSYLHFAETAKESTTKPTVFSGKYNNGQWFVPGGKSYLAHLFADAGANYIWKDNPSANSIALDFEVVLQKAQKADFWRILGGLNLEGDPYENLLIENSLYQHFKAFKQERIIYCDPFETAYFEKSTLEPDMILKDFIKAFHPELLPGYEPVYYKLMKRSPE